MQVFNDRFQAESGWKAVAVTGRKTRYPTVAKPDIKDACGKSTDTYVLAYVWDVAGRVKNMKCINC
jgi:hypothetical protein